jgi:hypothetical protein
MTTPPGDVGTSAENAELFPGIGVLPGPVTESHIVNRGTQ